MRCWVQVVGLATGDSVPAVVVGTEGARYLFNAGEGLQRFCTEHRARLVKVDGIFFTGVDTERLGGLPGMLLTLADMGKKSLRLFGGPGLASYLFATRHFMRRSDVAVEARELPPQCAGGGGGAAPTPVVFPDLTVEPVQTAAHDPAEAARAAAATSLAGFYDRVLTGSARLSTRFAKQPQQQAAVAAAPDAGASSVSSAGAAATDAASSGATRDIQGPFNPLSVGWWPGTAGAAPGGAPTPLPAIAAPPADVAAALPPCAYATSYVVTTPPITGKFHVAAARALGLPPGPLYGQLQRGRTVDARIPVDIARARGLVSAEAAEAARREHEAAVVAAAAAAAAAAEAAAAAAAAAVAAAAAAASAAASAAAAPASISDAAPPAAKRRKGEGAGAAAASAAAAGAGAAPPAHATVSARITPSMVKDDDVPGQAALIAACPSPAFLPALADAPQLARFYRPAAASVVGSPEAPPAAAARLRAVYHLCPPDVAALPAYRQWLARFPGDVTHVFTCALPPSLGGHGAVNGEPVAHSPPPFQPLLHAAQAHQLVKLHVLHPPAFPLPHPLPAEVAALAAATLPVGGGDSSSDAAASHLTPLQRLALRLLASDNPAQAAGALAATLAPPPAPPSVDPSTTGAVAVGGVVDGASDTSHHHHHRLQVVQATPLHQYVLTPLPALPNAASSAVAAASPGSDAAGPSAAPPAVNAGLALGEMLGDPDMAAYLRGALSAPPAAHAPPAASSDGATASCGHIAVDGDDGPGCGCAAATAAAADATLGSDVPADVAVTFTGTASAVPSKYRNVSGIYMQLPPVAPASPSAAATLAAPPAAAAAPAVLLDCGEGTYGQMCRRFGLPGSTHVDSAQGSGDPRDSDAAVAALRVAWISHMHADHHLGLPRVIAYRARALRGAAGEGQPSAASLTPLLVVGPTRLYQWLQEASVIDPSLLGAWAFADAAHFEVLPSSQEAAAAGPAQSPSPPLATVATEPSGDGAGCGPEGDDAAECTPLAASAASTAATSAAVPTPAAAAAVAAGFPPTMTRPLFIPLGGEGEGDDATDPAQQQRYHHRASREFVARALADCGIVRLAAIHVVHCARAYALRLDVATPSASSAPWSLVYSGDTRPCAQVVALGRGEVVPARPATTLLPSSPPLLLPGRTSLLIHEATFEDTPDGAANAVDKRHSTVGEALAVAAAVPARHTLLTHFSARYPKLPVLKLDAGSGGSGSGSTDVDDAAVTSGEAAEADAVAAGRTIFVTYDLMTVRGGAHMAALPRLLQPLHLLFREEEEEEDEAEDEEGDDEGDDDGGAANK